MENQELMAQAKAALEFSYAPYSNFHVGAAVLTADGSVFRGCNIENASYGATICAERTAMFKAISQGNTDLCRIAIAAGDGSTAYPCGICLQVMQEFMPEGQVLLECKNQLVVYKVKDLLPHGFQL